MHDDKMFELAVQVTCAKLQAHFIAPTVSNFDDWFADQVWQQWSHLRQIHAHGKADTTDRHA